MAKGTVTVIHPDGIVTNMPFAKKASLEHLQASVGGGLVQVVPLFDTYEGADCVALCNEEGKILGMQVNTLATSKWRFAHGDVLVGPIAILQGDKAFMRDWL